jgi:hypothetical protein
MAIMYENLIKQICFIPFYLSKIMIHIIVYYAHMLCLCCVCIFSFTSLQAFYVFFLEIIALHVFMALLIVERTDRVMRNKKKTISI